MTKVALTLLARRGCSLCEALEIELSRWDDGRGLYALEVVDIDTDADLLQRYMWRIPVLKLAEQELCAGHLSAEATSAIEAATA